MVVKHHVSLNRHRCVLLPTNNITPQTLRQAVRKETSHTQISHFPDFLHTLSSVITLPPLACLFFFFSAPRISQHARGARTAGRARLSVLPRDLASNNQLRCGGAHPATWLSSLSSLLLSCPVSRQPKFQTVVGESRNKDKHRKEKGRRRRKRCVREPSKPWGNPGL